MADLDRLIGDYLAAAHEQAARMQALARRPGPEELLSLRLAAHRLRGSGQSFGFPEITRIAGRIEDLAVEALAGTPVSGAPLASWCDDLAGEVSRARAAHGEPATGPRRDDPPARKSAAAT